MKIGFIVSSFPELSQTFILNQVTGIIDSGNDLRIFSLKHSEQNMVHPEVEKYGLKDKVIYIEVPKNKIRRILKALNIIIGNIHNKPVTILKSLNIFKYKKDALSLRLICQIAPFLGEELDIIHCFFGPVGLFGLKLRELNAIKAKIATSFHGFDISKSKYTGNVSIYKTLFEKGDIFLPVCGYLKNKLLEFGCDEEKITIHRMGIGLEKFRYRKSTINSSIRLLSVGRLIEKKGFSYSIEAVSRLTKDYPDLVYNIIGDGRLRNELDKLIDKLNCGKNIKIHGFKTNEGVARLFNSSDILLAPSVETQDGDGEGIPNVLKEAMAVGLPVVSTSNFGIPELVKDGVSGYLVPEGDIDAITEKIMILIKNTKMREDMGANGRKYIEENYDIKKLNPRLLDIYERVVNEV